MRHLGILLLFAFVQTSFARTQFECVQSLLDSMARTDVLPSGVRCLSVGDVCGPALDELGCATNAFFDIVRSYCTNLCVTGEMEDRLTRMRFKEALALLDRYSPQDSVHAFSFCVTNVVDSSLVKHAAFAFSKACGAEDAIGFYESQHLRTLPRERMSSICEGIAVAFEQVGGSPSETNMMVRWGMSVLPSDTSYWGGMDETLCDWWPAYATSSNRYVAAQRALQADPPCASSNYLARVIAELEALPPGTMQMLSTNHLGQAWGE